MSHHQTQFSPCSAKIPIFSACSVLTHRFQEKLDKSDENSSHKFWNKHFIGVSFVVKTRSLSLVHLLAEQDVWLYNVFTFVLFILLDAIAQLQSEINNCWVNRLKFCQFNGLKFCQFVCLLINCFNFSSQDPTYPFGGNFFFPAFWWTSFVSGH